MAEADGKGGLYFGRIEGGDRQRRAARCITTCPLKFSGLAPSLHSEMGGNNNHSGIFKAH